MVSTRSQSRLSGSSLKTGAENVDDGREEVTSRHDPDRGDKKKAQARTTRRTGALLEPIQEEGEDRLNATVAEHKKSNSERSKNRDTKGPVHIDDSLIDTIASAMFAALGDGNKNNKDLIGSSTENKVDLTMKDAEKLHWRPKLELPGLVHKEETNPKVTTSRYQHTDHQLVDEKRSNSLSKHLYVPQPDTRAVRKASKAAAPDTAGKAWFDLPATTITDEVKNDLRILRLRSALDPKTFYKKFDTTAFPKYFQFGTVVEGAGEYYSSRLTRKERKRTLTEEIMSDPYLTEVRKRRYHKMQEEHAKMVGRGRPSDNPRLKKKPRKSKH